RVVPAEERASKALLLEPPHPDPLPASAEREKQCLSPEELVKDRRLTGCPNLSPLAGRGRIVKRSGCEGQFACVVQSQMSRVSRDICASARLKRKQNFGAAFAPDRSMATNLCDRCR